MHAELAENPLWQYFENNTEGRRVNKWFHYFEPYHRYFAPFRNREITLVEFGVAHGGSLQMWKHYFGPKARIVGVDIKERCRSLAEDQIEIHIGDQGDREFLRRLVAEVGPIDLVVDDGGHRMEQQINTFEEVFPAVKDGGVFLIEDLHTSYWDRHGGGLRREGTFIEYAKGLVDRMHAWHSEAPDTFKPDYYTENIHGMHFYDSMLVIEKRRRQPPGFKKMGKPSF